MGCHQLRQTLEQPSPPAQPQKQLVRRNGGEFFAKLDRPDPFWQEARPSMLAIEDPRDPNNDLGKGSFNFDRQIRPAMDFAYQQLSAPSKADESILARIVRCAWASSLRGSVPARWLGSLLGARCRPSAAETCA